MSKLTKEDIKHLSKLCRIECTEEEQEALMENLSSIIECVESLSEVDTEGVEPCNHVLEDVINVLRKDEESELLDRETFLNNSPDHVGGMVRTPPVIKF